MTIRRIPSQVRDLPTFTYTKAAKNAVARHSGRAQPKGTIHKAVSIYKGDKEYTRRVSENIIDLARWESKDRPRGYPVSLQYPEDMLKAVLYTERTPPKRSKADQKSKTSTRTQLPEYRLSDAASRCASCKKRLTTISALCNCTTTPWDTQNTEAWQKQNINLRWTNEDPGVGTYALQSSRPESVLGEYVVELVRADDTDSRYLLGIDNRDEETVANIDSLRFGNWTRFINHSCRPNVRFQVVRVGEGIRVIRKATRLIREDEEVTIDYGDRYWVHLNENGVWCGCGEAVCMYNEEADAAGTADASKKGKKGKRKAR